MSSFNDVQSRATASVGKFVDDHVRLLTVLAIVGLLLYAWHNRFMEDDAFISFRYADQLVHGNGLVWNPGERVEGYTNFLWTLIMAVPIRLGWDAAVVSQILGLICFTVSLVTTLRCLLLVIPSRAAALLGMLLLGTNYTFSAFATSGLETQLQAALLLIIAYLWLRQSTGSEWSERGLVAVSFLAAAALLTRPDSAALLLVLIGAIVLDLIRRRLERRALVNALSCLFVPAVVIIGSWLVWKVSYYGDLLPNSYYVKVASPTSPSRGAFYIYSFVVTYVLYPLIAGVIVSLPGILRQRQTFLIAILLMLGLWTIYIVMTGGDHMEFRFFVPVLPFIIMLFIWVSSYWSRYIWISVLSAVLMVAGSVYHQLTYPETADPEVAIAPLWQYDGTVTREDNDWRLSGLALGRAFGPTSGVTIGVTPAGAIPYYSRLHSIDMLGINDPWVARHGIVTGTTPGHQRIAPMSYLVRRNVNLVVAHPVIINKGAQLSRIPIAPMDSIISFRDATFVLVPIDSSRDLVTLYLVRHPAIDSAIVRHRWEVVEARIH